MTTRRRIAALTSMLAGSACTTDDDADAPQYMFELSRNEIESIAAAYVPDADPEELAMQLEAPFDCAAFGDACERLGAERAELLVEEVWTLARAGAPAQSLHDAAAAEFSAPQAAMAAASSATATALCPGPRLGMLRITVSKSTLGLMAYGEVAYDSTRTVAGPVPFMAPDPVDATIDLEITTLVGVPLYSSTTPTVATASASVGRLVFSPFIHVTGEVDTTGCPAVSADI